MDVNNSKKHRYHVKSSKLGDRLLKGANSNQDEVQIRLIFLKKFDNVWENDIMYCNNCMNKYIRKFQHVFKKLLGDDFENPEKI